MSEPRMIQCAKLGTLSEGLSRPPFKNELGQRIFDTISKEAWKGWLAHSTMLINEYRIDLLSKQGTEFLLKECDKYFFGEGSQLPTEFKPTGHDHAGHGHAGHDHAAHEHVHGDHCNHDHK